MLWRSHHFSFFLDSPLWCLPVGSRYLLWSNPIPSLPDALTATNFAVRSSDSPFLPSQTNPLSMMLLASFSFGRDGIFLFLLSRRDRTCSVVPLGHPFLQGGHGRGSLVVVLSLAHSEWHWAAGWWVKRIIPCWPFRRLMSTHKWLRVLCSQDNWIWSWTF